MGEDRILYEIWIDRIEPFENELIDTIHGLFAETFGDDYLSREEVVEYVTKTLTIGCFARGELVAAIVAVPLHLYENPDDIYKFFNRHLPLSRQVETSNTVEILELVVASEWQRQGIGSMVLGEVINEMVITGFSKFIATCIRHDGLYESKRLLENHGFSRVTEITDTHQGGKAFLYIKDIS